MKQGLFITIEGCEGSGKTTLARALALDLKKAGHSVLLTFEPGDHSLGKVLRNVLLASQNHSMSPLTELFLFEADRAQHVQEVILPALGAGKIVLCGRYCDSTTAYQGYGRGLPLRMVESLNSFATGGWVPDLTLLLDIAPEKGLPRAYQARGKKDRLESEAIAFHRRLRKGFLALAKKYSKRMIVIRADQPFEKVKEEAQDHLQKVILKRN
ncbi:MAG: dTMP kinase [Chlamydiae bacterium]|nr:dTMP kinase [Chlamydiota bacterium]MBI3265906.1 dTMP kinase [Chlamydiota bacterium]